MRPALILSPSRPLLPARLGCQFCRPLPAQILPLHAGRAQLLVAAAAAAADATDAQRHQEATSRSHGLSALFTPLRDPTANAKLLALCAGEERIEAGSET